MSRIPLGNFGNSVPQAGQTPTAGANFGQAATEAAQRLGSTAVQVASQQIHLQAIEQEKADRLAEAKARTTSQNLTARTQDQLEQDKFDIESQIASGKLPTAQALEAWQKLSTKRVSEGLAGVAPQYQEGVGIALNGKTELLGRQLSRTVQQRDQADVGANIDQTLEFASRQYAAGNREGADKLVDAALSQDGPAAGWNAEQIQRKRQAYREGSRYVDALGMVTNARRSNAQLDAVAKQLETDQFADLDPQRRAALYTQIEGFRVSNEQLAEAAARRAEAQAQTRLNKATTAFTAASALINSGKVLSDDYVTQLSQTVAGTEYAKVLPELLKQAPERSAFGMQPLGVQQATLLQARSRLNREGTNPQAEKQVAQLEQIYQQSVKDYSEDPLPAAQERGLLQSIEPLQLGDVRQLVGSMAARVAQAEQVSATAGRTVSPFLKTEAEQIGKVINALPVEQRSSAIAQIAEVAGPAQAAAIGRQMAPKDKALGIAMGMAGSKTTSGRYSSELVLRGAQAIKDRSVKEDNAAITGVRGSVAAAIGDAVSGPARDALIDAAVFTQYGLMAEGSGDLPRAIRLATGGITERAGKKVVLPYGVDEATFGQRVQQVNAQTFASQAPDGQVYIAGKPMPVEQFAAQVPNAALTTAGNGRYFIQAAGGIATNKAGRPIVLEVR